MLSGNEILFFPENFSNIKIEFFNFFPNIDMLLIYLCKFRIERQCHIIRKH